MLFNGKYYNKPGHLGMTRAELKEALAGVPVKVIHTNLSDNIVSEDYDTFMSYFEMYEAGKCVLMVDVSGDGIVSMINNWEGPGYFWSEINPDTGILRIYSANFVVDPEEKTVTLSHYTVTFTGTIEG